MKSTILIALCFLCNTIGAQNLKPRTKPDTLSDNGNVLTNDVDPNGDPMIITKFNGTPLRSVVDNPIKGCVITKKDTGIFTLFENGWLKVAFSEGFYGTIPLNYYVNDGKAGGGKTEKIILIKAPLEHKEPYGYFKAWVKTGCVDKPNGKYKFNMLYMNDTIVGAELGIDNISSKTPDGLTITSTQYYAIFPEPATKEKMYLVITPSLFNFVKTNGCKE